MKSSDILRYLISYIVALKAVFLNLTFYSSTKKGKLQYVLTFLQDQDGEIAAFLRDKAVPPPVFTGGGNSVNGSVRAYTHGAFP